MKEKKWETINKLKIINEKLKIEDVIKILLENRGLKTKKDVDAFLNSDLTSVTPKTVGIDFKQLAKALKRIQKAIKEKEQIVIFGDYDVDGITGTAILWETLHSLDAHVVPYIPNRIEEGYGLSIKGIENCKLKIENCSLIITVDNGIVANKAVEFANKNGIDVVVTDHHTIGKEIPKAHAIVHTTSVCGAGVGYLLSQELIKEYHSGEQSDSRIKKGMNSELRLNRSGQARITKVPNDHLALVALATVADLVPLIGANRILLKFGLEELRKTTRLGLASLFQEAQIEPEKIGVYEIGHVIGPRLNAMGRLESAMDSLRLLCTKDRLRAKVLADTLGRTNHERQILTRSAAMHAIEQIRFKIKDSGFKKLLFIAHEEYEEGIIGLVAGKLVEEFYLPAIVLSKGETLSKASARSISGFNIIEFIRSSSHLLVNAGGHPMAAGFTVETQNIFALQESLEKLAENLVDGEMLQRILKIDCALPLEIVTKDFYLKLQELSPFGMGNPEPTFVSSVVVEEVKTVGKEKSHLKLKVRPSLLGMTDKISYSSSEAKPNREVLDFSRTVTLEAIAFGFGDMANTLKPGDKIKIVYTISENEWNGRVNLQLKVKDIKDK